VVFLGVYVLEAHPRDGWQLPSNIRDNILFSKPRNYQERTSLAQTCVTRLDIKFPIVVDDFNNSTAEAYSAWPDRIYLVDAEGRIAYKGRPGPFGFKPQELIQALAALLKG
jgi:Iodothyronine deiodinase